MMDRKTIAVSTCLCCGWKNESLLYLTIIAACYHCRESDEPHHVVTVVQEEHNDWLAQETRNSASRLDMGTSTAIYEATCLACERQQQFSTQEEMDKAVFEHMHEQWPNDDVHEKPHVVVIFSREACSTKKTYSMRANDAGRIRVMKARI